MFVQSCDTVLYIYRKRVLHYLMLLMKKVLLPEERTLILLHCGVGTAAPMEFNRLAKYFHLDTSKITEQRYNEAVQKTRAAIPGSELEKWIASYEPVGRS